MLIVTFLAIYFTCKVDLRVIDLTDELKRSCAHVLGLNKNLQEEKKLNIAKQGKELNGDLAKQNILNCDLVW